MCAPLNWNFPGNLKLVERKGKLEASKRGSLEGTHEVPIFQAILYERLQSRQWWVCDGRDHTLTRTAQLCTPLSRCLNLNFLSGSYRWTSRNAGPPSLFSSQGSLTEAIAPLLLLFSITCVFNWPAGDSGRGQPGSDPNNSGESHFLA